MKILLTGGGTGGHFYPLIAVASELRRISDQEHLLAPQLYFMAPAPYDEAALAEQGITFFSAPAGKVRRYHSLINVFDVFKMGWGMIIALIKVFTIYPDIVFSKGGYASVPAVTAARILGIPVVIHDSDARPGRATLYAAKFARAIAVSYPEAVQFFPESAQKKIAVTGNPTRKELERPQPEGAREFLGLEEKVPVILVLGGSQGAQMINDVILDAAPDLIDRYQIIHQVGEKNIEEVRGRAGVVLHDNKHAQWYRPYPMLNTLALKMAAGVADLVISRAGSTIFEIASWGVPSIIVPIPMPVSHDQTSNAYAYARGGACIVMEEKNLHPHLLVSEIDRLINNTEDREKMKRAARDFATPEAAGIIAKKIIDIALEHEK